MPLFSFEVLRPDGSNLVADKRDLPSNAEVWGHLEVLAIQLRRHRDVQLRVKDSDGSIVILSGIGIPIATIERCRRTTCPIKELLASGARTCARAPCMSIPVSEIPWLDLPAFDQFGDRERCALRSRNPLQGRAHHDDFTRIPAKLAQNPAKVAVD